MSFSKSPPPNLIYGVNFSKNISIPQVKLT